MRNPYSPWPGTSAGSEKKRPPDDFELLMENLRELQIARDALAIIFRIRVGAYHIVYQIQDEVLVVLTVDIGHRREIYR